MEELSLNPRRSMEPAPADPAAFDYALAIAKVTSLVFPFFGAGVTLVDLVTAPSRGKRLADWCEELRLRLNELSQKVDGLTPEALAKDEAFISAFAQATQLAVRTHQAEKLEALRNAVINTAISKAPADDLQSIFLNLVDSFTPAHLKLLSFFQAPDNTIRDGFRRQRDLSDQVICDLRDRGLLQDTRPYAARNRDDSESLVYYDWEVTTIGKQFLDFIGAPKVRR